MMAIFLPGSRFHDPQNPKCRACEHWGTDPANQLDYYDDCQHNGAPIPKKRRAHNDRACRCFQLARWWKEWTHVQT